MAALILALGVGAYVFLGNDIPSWFEPEPPQVRDHALAPDIVQSSRQPTERVERFATTDSRAYSWLEIGPVTGEHTIEWTWIAPNGALAYENSRSVGTPNRTQEAVRTWSWIPLGPSNDGAVHTGEWQVAVTLDGKPVATDAFTLEAGDGSPAAECGEVLYADSFDQADSGWTTRSEADTTLGYTDDGRYRIATERAGNVVWSWAPLDPAQLPERFCFDVAIAPPSAANGAVSGAMGLVFGGEPQASRLVSYGIGPDSRAYRVRRRDFESGASENLVTWTRSQVVRAEESNRLRLIVRPERVGFVVNGQRVETLQLDAHGAFGVFAESFEQVPLHVEFTQVELRALID